MSSCITLLIYSMLDSHKGFHLILNISISFLFSWLNVLIAASFSSIVVFQILIEHFQLMDILADFQFGTIRFFPEGFLSIEKFVNRDNNGMSLKKRSSSSSLSLVNLHRVINPLPARGFLAFLVLLSILN